MILSRAPKTATAIMLCAVLVTSFAATASAIHPAMKPAQAAWGDPSEGGLNRIAVPGLLPEVTQAVAQCGLAATGSVTSFVMCPPHMRVLPLMDAVTYSGGPTEEGAS